MGVVIRRWVWLETIGVVSGCFPHIYPYSTCIYPLSLQKVRNFAHFLGIFKYRIHHEILN